MVESVTALQQLSDCELVAEVTRLAASERVAIAKLVSALSELDARRLYLGLECSSMFIYCTQVLHLAEHAAFNRIEVARAARRFPIIFTLLADGRVHLSAVRLLAPHLTEANHQALLLEASHKSKREIEEIVARLQPRPDAPSSIRRILSTKAPHLQTTQPLRPECDRRHLESSLTQVMAERAATPIQAQRPVTKPLAPGRYKIQLTVAEETYRKLRRVQDLLRHRVPDGDLVTIFDRALTLLLADVEKSKVAATERPRASSGPTNMSRRVPAGVRRAVWARDGGRCRFEGAVGRCCETGRLEFHHVIPYARGGPTTADNLELRCAAHNRYEAEQCFGLFVRETFDRDEAARDALNLPEVVPA